MSRPVEIKPDAEMELLQQVQTRGKVRKLAVLTRLRAALDLPIDEHLDELAADLAGRTRGEQDQ